MSTTRLIRVAVVEDDTIFLEEVCNILDGSPETALVARFSTVSDACRGLTSEAVDVVLVDMDLTDGSGSDVISSLRRSGASMEFIVLTWYADDRHLFPALEAGAVSYILKDSVQTSELIPLVKEVMQGGSPMSHAVARRVLSTFSESRNHAPRGDENALEDLTAREQEILEDLSAGYVTKEVAKRLNISYETVRCHQKNIYRKLQTKSALQAVMKYKRAKGGE